MSEGNLVNTEQIVKLALDVKDLYKYYFSGARKFAVLKGLSYQVPVGKMFAIMGPSGAGKSTLLNIIGGLDRFDSGELWIANKQIKEMKQSDLSAYRNRHVGFIFQSHNLLQEFTALENVALPLLVRREKRKIAFDRAKSILHEVGLAERMTHRPSQMSGGENQRVAVARALVTDPTLVLADEPTGNLDRENSKMLMELLLELKEKQNRTIILVTHDRELAEMTQHIDKMVDGVIQNTKE